MIGLDPATVQAWSAVVVAALTLVLAGATVAYVRRTAELATQAKRTNDLAYANTERTLRLEAPSFTVQEGGRALIEELEEWAFRNVGHQVVIKTAFGSSDPTTVVNDNAPHGVEMRVPFSVLDREAPPAHPKVQQIVFTDPGGTRWSQMPEELPRLEAI
jgi:hypothetical protein